MSAITLFLGGDTMLGRGVGEHLETLTDKARIWGDALNALRERSPDVSVVNLETAVTTSEERWPNKRFWFRSHPDNTAALTGAGFDLCCLANNHTLDAGYQGLTDTLAHLRDAGIPTAGAGQNAAEARIPTCLPLPGGARLVTFAWAHLSSFTPRKWAATSDQAGINLLPDFSLRTLNDIRRQIARVRQPGDIILASIHWGPNWSYRVSLRRRWFARRLVDYAGVDVIHGHSSHHPMAAEVYRNRLILYGCGDFINDYDPAGHPGNRPDLVLMYFPTLEQDGTLKELSAVPLRIDRKHLVYADADDVEWLCNTLNAGGGAMSEERTGRLSRLHRSRFNTRWTRDGGDMRLDRIR